MRIENQADFNFVSWQYKYLWKDYQKLLRKKKFPVGFKRQIIELNAAFDRFQKMMKTWALNPDNNISLHTFGELADPNSFVEEG